jgi:L-ribulose-5-phosphate 3-epimerase
MKYSMMTCSLVRAFPRGGPIDMKAVFDFTAELGLDALDQNGLYGYAPADLKRMADDRGIRIICYTEAAHFACPSGTYGTPEAPGLPNVDRTRALDKFKSILDTAFALGAPMIMTPVPGRAIAASVSREENERARADSRRWAIECFAAVAPLARAAGVTMTTEHFAAPNSPFILSDELEEAVRAVPDLRITLDNGNVYTGGEDPIHAFERHKDRIAFIHFKDWEIPERREEGWFTGLDGRSYRPALIGQGVLDYPSMLKALRAAKYAGYINLEYEDSRVPPFEAVRSALRWLRESEAQAD